VSDGAATMVVRIEMSRELLTRFETERITLDPVQAAA
jgi:hypothetical protein